MSMCGLFRKKGYFYKEKMIENSQYIFRHEWSAAKVLIYQIFSPCSPAVSLVTKPYLIKPFGDVYQQ